LNSKPPSFARARAKDGGFFIFEKSDMVKIGAKAVSMN